MLPSRRGAKIRIELAATRRIAPSRARVTTRRAWLVAVSYTHLDVYKRQEHLSILAEAAQMFSDHQFRERLLVCKRAPEVKRLFDAWPFPP